MEIKLNLSEIKKDFPILSKKINGKQLIYLDNAATTQKPSIVIDSLSEFYKNKNANVHRAIYTLGEEATEEYDSARKTLAQFINSSEKEVVFTRGTTESINLLAYSLPSIIVKGKDEIVLSQLEHHSNIVPWQELAKRAGFKLKFISIKKDLTIDYEDAAKIINNKTAIVSITHKSNVFGCLTDIKKIISLAHSKGALTIIDAAQSIAHMKIDVRSLDCDFLVFSGHKLYGPTGIGALYGKYNLLDKMSPFNFGGSMISKVEYSSSSYSLPPIKFEAGTPNISGAIGLAAAIEYLNKIGLENISKIEKELGDYAVKKLKTIQGINIYYEKGEGIISFNLDKIHSHDVASLLNDYNICIRAGHHCAMPLMQKLNIAGTCRVSLSFYNTFEEIDSLVFALQEIKKVFKNG